MKKTILFFALILGMSGMAVAQTCGTGGGYANYGNDYYYNSNTTSNYGSLGVINSRWKGFFDRSRVIDARLIRKAPSQIMVQYTLDNGDVLRVHGNKIRGKGPRANQGRGNQGYGNRVGNNGSRSGNNYTFNSNRQFVDGEFAISRASLNGRPLPVNFGTLFIQDGSGRRAKTVLDMQVGKRSSFEGTVRVFK